MRSMVTYGSFLDATKDLDPEIFKEAWVAILQYGIDRVEPIDLSAPAKMFFLLVKPLIDKNFKRRKDEQPTSKDEQPTSGEQLSTIANNCEHSSNDEEGDGDVDEDGDKDGDVEQAGEEEEESPRGGETQPADQPAGLAHDLALILEDGTDWLPEPELYDQLKTAYADIDVDAELRRMRAACLIDPKKRRSAKTVRSFVLKWLRNAEKDQTEQPKETSPPNSTARKGFGDFEQRNYDDDFYAALERQAALGGRA